jgi:hypothetical protein
MHRRHLVLVLAALAATAFGAPAPAAAQFGNLFDPPRPPSEVPSRPAARPAPPPPAQPAPEPYAGPPSPFQPTAPRGGVQSQPLPPPPGATAAPPPAQPPVQQGTFAPAPAGPATPGQPAPPAAASLQPGDEVVTAPPAVKIANPTAVFAGLDKITGRITTFEATINETVEFGALRVTARACYTRPPTEPQNTDGFLEVDEITLQKETRRIFTGWMFAASPGLHAVEHPIYDVWLTDCKGGDPTTLAGAKPPEPEPPPAPAPTPQRRAPTKKR